MNKISFALLIVVIIVLGCTSDSTGLEISNSVLSDSLNFDSIVGGKYFATA